MKENERPLSVYDPVDRRERYVTVRGERFRLFLDRETIRKRTAELGADLSRDYEGTTPILIGVLNGAFMFLADLMREMHVDCEVDFWKLSSYGARKVTTGEVRELKKPDADLKDRHVIVVEDVVDTGLSIRYVVDRIRSYRPASLRVATLLQKQQAEDVEVHYVGFRIPNAYVVGYGLDYGQLARNLPDLYILDADRTS